MEDREDASRSQEIVDGHMHFYSPATHSWAAKLATSEEAAASVTYLPEHYKRDIAGYRVVQSVHVEAGWPGDPVGETDWLEGLADGNESGFPHAIVGHCDLSSPNVEEILSRHCQSKRFRGIRQNILNFDTDKFAVCEPHNAHLLDDPRWLEGLAQLERRGLCFELHLLAQHMHKAAEVMRGRPGLRVVLEHCGYPLLSPEGGSQDPLWRKGLEELAACPNVYCKVSGVFCTDSNWNQTSVESVVKPCLDIFGIERCVFGSNYPVEKAAVTFPQLLDTLTTLLQSYSARQRDLFFAGNARKIYQLGSKE